MGHPRHPYEHHRVYVSVSACKQMLEENQLLAQHIFKAQTGSRTSPILKPQ